MKPQNNEPVYRVVCEKFEPFYAVVYRKNDPYPIRHICIMKNTRRDKAPFFRWYYKNYNKAVDDTVEFFDTLNEAIAFEHKLKEGLK